MNSELAFVAGRSDEYDGMHSLAGLVRNYASTMVEHRAMLPALDADLGLALLVAEAAEDAGYEPVSVERG